MTQSFDLTHLDAHSFEHLVNFLSLKVLGNGVTGFTAGPDGGRDGYLRGKASYPTTEENWSGIWFIQSKFHKPHLSKDPQKWLIEQVKKEIEEFELGMRTTKPNNWIIATNIEPSGVLKTGAYDKIVELVNDLSPEINVDIWGGRKIIDFLHSQPHVVETYGHFLTPGHVITELYKKLRTDKNKINSLIEHLITNQFQELSYTKLEQAGSINDNRPKIYELFRDLPIQLNDSDNNLYKVMDSLVSSASNVQTSSLWEKFGDGWQVWAKNPKRARVILLKGGPGQGKSTAGQYFSQIQRAAFILSPDGPKVSPQIRVVANELKVKAIEQGFWPTIPRVPLFIELKDFANWYINKREFEPRNIISYVCDKIKIKTGQDFSADDIHEALKLSSWFVNFDGLDEVPNDVKDNVSNEIIEFTDTLIPRLDADVLILCTTRPQGYSGQFDGLFSSNVTLLPLPANIALECASAVVQFNRDLDESQLSINILKSAMESEQVRELMTTPLQAHIMAVVVRDGGRPPEKRWELFNNFYSVMKKRESLKNFPDLRISALLREQDQLLKAIHDRLGVSLHAKAEISSGAEATLNKNEFSKLARQTVLMQFDSDIDEQVDVLMEATTERLVFVNTPETSDSVRFDIRQLQEFFAAEFIYSAVGNDELHNRLEVICGDAHWREVIHFLLSALIYHKRLSELSVAINIIQSLDDDNHNHQLRSFKRKMGIGSLCCLRLLEEGMLEQDKRIRQQFSNCIAPLWNMTDQEILLKIVQVNKENSKLWMTNNLINSFFDLSYHQQISSGYLLSMMIDETHERFPEILSRLNDAPEEFLIATLRLHSDYIGAAKRLVVKNWFIELIIKITFSLKYNNKALQKESISFLSSKKELLRELMVELNITDEDKYLLGLMLFVDSFEENDFEEAPENNPYTFFSVSFRKKKVFHTLSENTTFPLSHDGYNRSPSKNLLIAFVMLGLDESTQNLRYALNALVANDFNCTIIPDYLKSALSINTSDDKNKDLIKEMISLDDEALKNLYFSIKKDIHRSPHSIKYFRWDESSFDPIKWQAFCSDYPDFSLRFWSGNVGLSDRFERLEPTEKESFYKPILELAYSRPELFSTYILSWHKLFRFYPEKAAELKSIFIKNLKNNPHNIHHRNLYSDPYFTINKETEKELIIILAKSIFIESSNFRTLGIAVRCAIDDFNENSIKGFGFDNQYLIESILDLNENDDFRVACFACLLSQTNSSDYDIKKIFFEMSLDMALLNLVSDVTLDLLTSSVFMLCNNQKIYDEKLMAFLGAFSDKIKIDYQNWSKIQNIYTRWRERSFAPVLKTDCLDKWLSYTY